MINKVEEKKRRYLSNCNFLVDFDIRGKGGPDREPDFLVEVKDNSNAVAYSFASLYLDDKKIRTNMPGERNEMPAKVNRHTEQIFTNACKGSS